MSTANVNFSKSIPVSELPIYTANKCDRGYGPQAVGVFGIATAAINGSAAAPATAYITPSGDVSTTAAETSLMCKVECAVAVGEGVWVKIAGKVSDGSYIVEALYVDD